MVRIDFFYDGEEAFNNSIDKLMSRVLPDGCITFKDIYHSFEITRVSYVDGYGLVRGTHPLILRKSQSDIFKWKIGMVLKNSSTHIKSSKYMGCHYFILPEPEIDINNHKFIKESD